MSDSAHTENLILHLDDEGHKVIASFTPGENTATITLEEFKRAIINAGFGGYSLDEKSLANATGKYNSGEAFEITVGEVLDGEFNIRISDDHLKVYLKCTPPFGGAPVQRKDVIEEAERKGVVANLDIDAIDKAINVEGEVQIASGVEPVHGLDGKAESLVPSIVDRSPRLDENGLADFREIGGIVTVHAGDALMRHIPPTDGRPGLDIFGKVIPAKPGKDILFASKLEGVTLDPGDPDLLIAAIDGYPAQTKNEVSVVPVYTVKDVDLHTGNITFDGMIHVTGDVHDGMTLKASGDIHVDGTVENALLEAGGDVVIKGGLLGGVKQDDKLRSAVSCGGSCTLRFVQNAHISAENGIFIKEYAMQSELSAGHQIIVGDKGSCKGNIIGGITRAAMLIKAHDIGSESYQTTVVIAGSAEKLHERLNEATELRETAEKKFSDIIRILEIAHLNPERVPPEKVELLTSTRDAMNSEMELLRGAEREIQTEIDLAAQAHIMAEKQVFVGVEICLGLRYRKIVSDCGGGVFRLMDDELVFE